jgi:hypothetical protein
MIVIVGHAIDLVVDARPELSDRPLAVAELTACVESEVQSAVQIHSRFDVSNSSVSIAAVDVTPGPSVDPLLRTRGSAIGTAARGVGRVIVVGDTRAVNPLLRDPVIFDSPIHDLVTIASIATAEVSRGVHPELHRQLVAVVRFAKSGVNAGIGHRSYGAHLVTRTTVALVPDGHWRYYAHVERGW